MAATRRAMLAGLGSVLALAVGFAVPTGAVAQSAGATSAGTAHSRDAALDRALTRLVRQADGPPGIAVVVQRGHRAVLHRAGTANLATGEPIRAADSMRLASVAKAFSGAVALSLVADGRLSLNDTIGRRLPGLLPLAWSKVTLRELLQHTSGIPDFSQNPAFVRAVQQSPQRAPRPVVLLSFAGKRLNFTPGSKYMYSNSDNIVVGLMVQAATRKSYESQLSRRVLAPLGLAHTSLPRGSALPSPFVHGYDIAPPESPVDVTNVFAAGWAWASGAVVSTQRDANAFIRAYARGATTTRAAHRAQFTFRPGNSDPPGPGRNSAGLAIFRYQTRCGTVYGHTGNTPGYTQFVAATRDGSRSVVVSINSQITPQTNPDRFPELRQIYTLAACAALAR
jgi:D-alanyl-D-alanine carboxypeptidase